MTESPDILRVGLLAPVENLDPRGAWEMGRALVASQIFETPYAVRGVSLDAVHRPLVLQHRDVAQEAPLVPLLYGPATAVHSWRVEGFTLSPIGHPSFAEMGFRS